MKEKNELTDAQKNALEQDDQLPEISEAEWTTIRARAKQVGVIQAVQEVTAISTAEQTAEKPDIVQTAEFADAFQKAMEVFAQFIIFEKDAPEEPRMLMFPSFTHIKKEDIDAEIVAMYTPGSVKAPLADVTEIADLDYLKIIQDGISDSISILKKRTEGKFPTPGTRALNQLEYESLSDLAWTETVTFYRITEADLVRGHVRLSSQHTMQANQPPGTRIRSWVAVKEFTKLFYDVLRVEEHQDIIADLIAKDVQIGAGYSCYFLGWREAGLL